MQNVTIDRDKFIGGSDVPIIMGLSPFKTRWQLLQEKAGVIENAFAGNEYTEYGNEMEPKIRDYINSIYSCNFIEDKKTVGHFRYHADGHDVVKNMLLEIKTTSQTHDTVSEYKRYLVQLLTGMERYGVENGFLAVYERPEDFCPEFDQGRLTVYPVNINDWWELLEMADAAIEEFWTDLERLKENPFLQEEDFQPFPVVANAQIVAELESQFAAYKTLEQDLKNAKANLKAAMEQYHIKTWTTPGGVKITLVPDGEDKIVREFDVKRFAEENSALMEPYMIDRVKKGRAGYVRVTLPK